MSELAEKVKRAAARRVRPGSVKIGGETFFFDFRVYPAAELGAIIDKLRRSDTATAAGLLAQNVLDPSDGRPVFTAPELEELPNCDLVKLTSAFFEVNNGGPEKN